MLADRLQLARMIVLLAPSAHRILPGRIIIHALEV